MIRAPLPRNLQAGAAILVTLLLTALAAPLLTGADPAAIDIDRLLEAPGGEHWMGTDGLGRDLFSRVLHGGRVSLQVGFMAAGFALLIGVPLGMLAGYFGKALDLAISRFIEAVLCFPSIVLAITLIATSGAWLPASDATRIALVLGATGWTPVARFLRGEFMRLKNTGVVEAARAAGSGHRRIMIRHILPAALAPVLVTTAFAVAAAIVAEALLSFLGLGIGPPTPSWGGLLEEARSHVDRAWWLALFPGGMLFLAVLACNLVGEGIRDWVDPT
ncbi:hypothetical protein ABI59_00050 [Acidobacteria bacterium Mor1]|nr:hypothetical protein ABI59_00050 [Acidobacteria bacterium Mor1]